MNMEKDCKITIAKAIAIILMVVAHTGVDSSTAFFICMFHMPLFFFVSGFCFKEKYLDNIGNFVKRKASLYLYFVCFVVAFILLHNLFCYINFYTNEYLAGSLVVAHYSIKDYVINILKAIVGMSTQEPLIGGFWFLRSLLIASLLSIGALKLLKNVKLVTLVFLLLSYVIVINPDNKVLFWGSHFFLVSMFYSLGILMKDYYSKFNYKIIWIVVFFVIVLLGSIYAPCTTLSYNKESIIVLALCGLSGTLGTLFIGDYLSPSHYEIVKRYLCYIGDHTLSILALHFLSFKLVSLFIIALYNLPMSELSRYYISSCGYWWWIAYAVVGVNLPLLGYLFFQKISEKSRLQR